MTEDKESLKAALLASDVIIYDVMSNPDEAAWAVESNRSSIIHDSAFRSFRWL